MPGSDEGEFELVLGNKQLLSVFFVMVVLLGVFFTMGYVVGRNTAQVEVAANPPEPLVVQAGGTPGEPTQVASAVEPPETPVTRAAPPTQAEPEPEPPRVAQTAPPKPPAPRASPTPKPPAPAASSSSEPPTGTVFLQVAATSETEGGVLLEVMERRGFSGRLAPVPGQNLFRVLIGPLAGANDLSETRTALQEAGFQPFTRRY